MKEKNKQEQRQRFLRQAKKFRTLEERKEIEARSRARKQQQRDRKPQRVDWDDEDAPTYEKIHRAGSIPKKAPSRELVEQVMNAPEASAHVATATILEVHSGRVRVMHEGDLVMALMPKRRLEESLVVGDLVSVEALGAGEFRVIERYPRRTILSRPDPSRAGKVRVQAANIDRVVIVVPATTIKSGLIDRYLIAIEQGGASPLLVVNKRDLIDDDQKNQLEDSLELYDDLNVTRLWVSAKTGEGMESLLERLRGFTAVFVGQSGVGKSSLLNRLSPDSLQPVNEVRAKDEKGRHTTTSSRLVYADAKTRIIDTPGIRAFGLAELDHVSLAPYFPDFPSGCRFSNCRHVSEPDCAVKESAQVEGPIARRYRFYLRLLESIDEGGTTI